MSNVNQPMRDNRRFCTCTSEFSPVIRILVVGGHLLHWQHVGNHMLVHTHRCCCFKSLVYLTTPPFSLSISLPLSLARSLARSLSLSLFPLNFLISTLVLFTGSKPNLRSSDRRRWTSQSDIKIPRLLTSKSASASAS